MQEKSIASPKVNNYRNKVNFTMGYNEQVFHLYLHLFIQVESSNDWICWTKLSFSYHCCSTYFYYVK